MRRIVAIAAVLAAVPALLALGTAAGGEEGAYEVRAIFDSGGFLVAGEEVRIAGAKVGSISEVDVTGAEDWVHDDRSPEPGKAVVVLRIDDPGFQDFRQDASCLVRPQSLLGEKFIECQPTQPRAAGSEPPPPLEEIDEDLPGEGQLFLPVESNGKAVDLDLVNNIMEEPYPDRFRLILNNLGAGFAARGEELREIVNRSNPALRETNEVLAILARQNAALARLARDGDASLAPLARQRDRLSGFINNATVAAQATAERRVELEEGLQKLPGFLRELRLTMIELRDFSDANAPVISDFGDAAPQITAATRALGPFSDAGTEALRSLGDAAEESGGPLARSNPLISDIRKLAERTKPGAKELAEVLASLRRAGGYEQLMRFIFYSTTATSAFDRYGHILRAVAPANNCLTYEPTPLTGCIATWGRRALTATPASAPTAAETVARAQQPAGLEDVIATALGAEDPADPSAPEQDPDLEPPPPPAEPDEPAGDGAVEPPARDEATVPQGSPPAARSGPAMRDARALLDFLIGPGDRSGTATAKGAR